MTFNEWTKISIINNQPKNVKVNKPKQKYVPEVVMSYVLSKSELDRILDSFNHELVLNSP